MKTKIQIITEELLHKLEPDYAKGVAMNKERLAGEQNRHIALISRNYEFYNNVKDYIYPRQWVTHWERGGHRVVLANFLHVRVGTMATLDAFRATALNVVLLYCTSLSPEEYIMLSTRFYNNKPIFLRFDTPLSIGEEFERMLGLLDGIKNFKEYIERRTQ